MRIASNTVSESIVRQIQSLGSQHTKLQNQVATGQRIFQPEDDPSAVGRVLDLQSQQRQLAQYGSNAARALELSQSSFSGLQAIKKVSDRATEIGTLGGGVIGLAEAKAHASEVDQLIEQSVQLLNTKLGNDYLYAGNRVDQPPFVAARDAGGRITAVNYAGADTAATIPLSSTTTVTPTTAGDTNRGLGDFLNHLIALRDALNHNDTAAISTAQSGLITTEDGIVNALAEAGGVQARIEASRSQQQDLATSLESLVSREVDADLPSTIVKLNQTQTAYQAALQSASSIMKISLLDYIH